MDDDHGVGAASTAAARAHLIALKKACDTMVSAFSPIPAWTGVDIALQSREQRSGKKTLFSLGPLGVPLAVIVLVFSTIACALTPASLLGAVDVTRDALCLVAMRSADRVIVRLPIGTPRVRLSLLLQLSPAAPSMILWSPRLLASSSLACKGSLCSDAAIVSSGESKRAAIVEFTLVDDSHAPSVSYQAYLLGLDGVLYLDPGMVHVLTGSRFCVDNSGVGRPFHDATLVANVTNDRLFVHQHELGQAGLPLAAAPAADCADQARVELFPPEARVEQTWLHATSESYQHGYDALEARRRAVELAGCSGIANHTVRMASLLQTACAASGTCRASPSVPFRRAASSIIRFNASEDGERVTLEFSHSRALEWIPGLEDSGSAVRGAGLRILLLTLTALVIFVRSGDAPSPNRMFYECLVMVEEKFDVKLQSDNTDVDASAKAMEDYVIYWFGPDSCVYRALASFFRKPVSSTKSNGDAATTSTFWERVESCALGLLAIGTRIAVSVAKARLLTEDSNTRLVVSEIFASCLSFGMWLIRWLGTDSRHDRTLILGGTTAHIDAAAAVLLEFVEAPLRAETNVFAAIARMLIVVVLAFTVFVRLFFSVACCFMLADGVWRHEKDDVTSGLERYATVLVSYGLAWIAQAAAVGILLADAFVTPAVDSMSWNSTGSSLVARCVLSLVLVSLSLPLLNYTSAKAAVRAPDHER